MVLQHPSFRPVTYNDQLKQTTLVFQEAGGIQQQACTLGCHQTPHKYENRRTLNTRKTNEWGSARKSMEYGFRMKQSQLCSEPCGRHNVYSYTLAQKASDKSESPCTERREPLSSGAAVKAFSMSSCHEVTRARRILRLLQQLPARANGVESVMLHHHWLLHEQS